MAQHHDSMGAFLILSGLESASEKWRNAQHIEEIRCDRSAGNPLRAVLALQVEAGGSISRNSRHDVILLAPIREVRNRDSSRPSLGQLLPDEDQSLRVFESQRTQQHSVHDTEDRAVRANAER